jgi:hypothetical protein
VRNLLNSLEAVSCSMELVRSRYDLVVRGGSSVSAKAGISNEQTFRAQYDPVPSNCSELAVCY